MAGDIGRTRTRRSSKVTVARQRQAQLAALVEVVRVLPLGDGEARAAARIRGELERRAPRSARSTP